MILTYGRFLLGEVAGFVRWNSFWMTWNLFLAAFPVGLGVLLAGWPGRRRVLWWGGAGLFVLFLPNAAYLLTDLIHLPADVAAARMRGTVLVGILPAYALLVATGLILYSLALGLAGRVLDDAGRSAWRQPVMLALHLLSAVGVVIGRIGRLNSWNTVFSPEATVAGSLDALSWPYAPAAVVLLFLTLAASHSLLSAAGRSLGRRAGAVLGPA